MNLPKTSTVSLFQLVQETSVPPEPVAISPATLDRLVGAFLDVLIKHQLPAIIWVKSNSDKWLWELERYQQQDYAQSIYVCTTTQQLNGNFATVNDSLTVNQSEPTGVTYIPLTADNQLTQESFFLVLAPQLCSVILSQQHIDHANQETSVFVPPLSVVCAFEQEVIELVLETIQQTAFANRELPAELLADLSAPSPFPPVPDPNFLHQLILQQVQRTEELQQLETIIVPSQQESPEVSLDLKELVTQVARELRTPLTHMKTALSILESSKLKAAQRQRYLKVLHQQWEHQNSLIEGLLDLMQLEASPKVEKILPLSLAELIPGIVSTYQPLAMEKGIQLGYTIPANIPPVHFPSQELRQIVISLLSNSLKFTHPDGKVSVQVSQKREYVQIAFVDTGIGIAPIDLRRIFDRFYQGRSTPTDITGAGLGLTIVKQILQRYGGSISVTSQLRRGSAFKVLLPTVIDNN